jgi:hypothetical protein
MNEKVKPIISNLKAQFGNWSDDSKEVKQNILIALKRENFDIGTISFALSLVVTILWISTQWFWQKNSSYNGNNGDHFYYVAYAHMFNGVPYRQALELSAQYFHYARPSVVLDYEWMDVAIAPLVYPRVVLSSLIAVSMKIFGENGVWIPGLTFGCLTHIIWWRLLISRFGNRIAGLCMLAISLSPQLTELRFGIYTESPLVFFLTLWFYFTWKAFRLDQNVNTLDFAPLVLLCPLIGLTRQSLLLPFAYFISVAARRVLPGLKQVVLRKYVAGIFVVVVCLVTIQLTLNYWAPYDSTVFAMTQNNASSRWGLLWGAPENIIRIFFLEVFRLGTFRSTFDPVYLLMMFFCPYLIIKYCGWRRSVGWISVVGVCLITTYLNGRATGLRYMAPMIPATLCAVALDKPMLTKRTKVLIESASRSTAALFLLMICVVMSAAGTVTSRAKPLIWHPVSSATFPTTWPLKTDNGFLSCAGKDFQVWFKDSEGKIFAVSGPALQRRFFIPSIDEISLKPRTQLVSPTLDLMEFGMKLCGAEYMKR